MPVNPTFPGVYIEEIPSGVRTITGVATSITAFIGRAKLGPTDQETDKTRRAITINSFADFERIYGGLWLFSTLGYAVQDFFLNGGSQAIIVRLYHPIFADTAERNAAQAGAKKVTDAVATAAGGPNARASDVSKAASDAAKAVPATDKPGKTAANFVAQAAVDAANVSGATVPMVSRAVDRAVKRIMAPEKAPLVVAGLPLVAAYPGSWGGFLRGTVDFNVPEAAATNLGLSTSDLFNLTVQEEIPSGRIEQFLNLSLKDSARRIDKVLEEESKLVRWDTVNGPNLNTDSSTSASALAKVQNDFADADQKVKDAQKALDDIKKNNGDTTQAEKDLAAAQQKKSAAENAFSDPVTGAEKELAAAQKKLKDDTKAGKSNDDLKKDRDAITAAQTNLENAIDAMQASDGDHLIEEDFTLGKADKKEGLFALELVDLFNILCIPPYLPNNNVDQTLISDVATFCEAHRAMLLVDSPSAWVDKDTAKNNFGRIITRSKNAALFFPRLRKPNILKDNKLEDFVPCGALAGIFARTDTQRGVWKAPAGLDATLVGVPQLSVLLTDGENGELNPLGINCLRVFPAAGRVVWGSRTLQGNDNLASEWKYIPVRRLALYIEESLFRGTQWVVFEPNDEPLWAQIRLNVGAFMQNLFRQGAFQGQSPRDAYFVKCDKETTTQNDINLGIVNIVVGFAPLKPAEFVIIKLQQIAGQIQV